MSQIDVSMKMGILHTVAKSIYSSQSGKFREAIANANDNGATRVLIYADQATMRISLFDNGKGISKSKYEQIFSSLGVGLDKANEAKLSYFGLGLMSVLQIGKKATIYSKTASGETTVLIADVEKIFLEENEVKGIEFLSECLIPKYENPGEREDYSSVSSLLVESIFGTFPNHFTEIIIEGLTVQDFNEIISVDFKNELRKILPLEPIEDEQFIKNIKDIAAQKRIYEILSSDFCPTLDVYFGADTPSEVEKLYKYFPDFKSKITFGDSNIHIEETPDFVLYMIFASEDLEEENKPTSETGFWVRNQNFLVKRADYLSQPGRKSKLLTGPIKNWVFGEIFHKNMNSFLVVARDDYVWESDGFLQFQQSVVNITERLNRDLRKVWANINKIIKSVVEPFLNIDTPKGPFEKAYATLATLGVIKEAKDAEEILLKIQQNHGDDLHLLKRIDEIFGNNVDSLILADDSDGTLVIAKELAAKNSQYEKSFDLDTNKVKVVISPELFKPKKVTFLGKRFNIIYVVGTDENQAININVQKEEIRINPFNHQMLQYSVSFLDVYVAIEIAFELSAGSTRIMKDYLYSLLGRDYKDTGKYFGPLGDDLMRFARSNR
jgi:hypothetical protein